MFLLPAYRLDLGSLLNLDFQQFPEKQKTQKKGEKNESKKESQT